MAIIVLTINLTQVLGPLFAALGSKRKGQVPLAPRAKEPRTQEGGGTQEQEQAHVHRRVFWAVINLKGQFGSPRVTKKCLWRFCLFPSRPPYPGQLGLEVGMRLLIMRFHADMCICVAVFHIRTYIFQYAEIRLLIYAEIRNGLMTTINLIQGKNHFPFFI